MTCRGRESPEIEGKKDKPEGRHISANSVSPSGFGRVIEPIRRLTPTAVLMSPSGLGKGAISVTSRDTRRVGMPPPNTL
jgi:hypothetical protein